MQRPDFSQSPKRVGSGPSRPPISRGLALSATGESGAESARTFVADEPCAGGFVGAEMRSGLDMARIMTPAVD